MYMKIPFNGAVIAIFLLLGAGCTSPLLTSVSPAPQNGASNITVPVPVSSSTTQLNLSGSGLKSIPGYVFAKTELTGLDVSNNNLTGAIQGEIRFLKNLQTLNASGNQMTGVPAEIGQLSALRDLDLSENNLTGLPLELGNLQNLRRLDLRGNAISKQDLDAIRAKLTGTEILE